MSSILKKGFSIILVLTMLFSFLTLSSSAIETNEDEYGVMPCWTYIDGIATSFTISGIVATASVLLTAQENVYLLIKIELQKEESTGYETIETWSIVDQGTMVGLEGKKVINIYDLVE